MWRPAVFLAALAAVWMGPSCSGYSAGSPPPPATPSPCDADNATSSSVRLVDSFKTDLVRGEFIVKFSGFYQSDARRGFISAAFQSLDVGPDLQGYEVLERNNPMAA